MRFQHDLEGQPCLSREPVLKSLVVGNLLASGAHFAHNAAFFDAYPEPPWIPGPWFVVLVWLLIAPVLVKGYYWHQEGKSSRAPPRWFFSATSSRAPGAHRGLPRLKGEVRCLAFGHREKVL